VTSAHSATVAAACASAAPGEPARSTAHVASSRVDQNGSRWASSVGGLAMNLQPGDDEQQRTVLLAAGDGTERGPSRDRRGGRDGEDHPAGEHAVHRPADRQEPHRLPERGERVPAQLLGEPPAFAERAGTRKPVSASEQDEVLGGAERSINPPSCGA
jgi:hypothetical protein